MGRRGRRSSRDVTTSSHGRAVGGEFAVAGGLVTPHFASVVTNCPPSHASYGSPCAGSGGLNVLVVDDPAWLGGTYRATASGLAPGGIGVAVYGFAREAMPMSAVHPAGAPGCTLWNTADLLIDFVPATTRSPMALPIPNSPPLAGATFYHQVVSLEVPVGSLTSITGTNGVAVTIGAF